MSDGEDGGDRAETAGRDRLRRAALHHLERYAASEAGLRRVLVRRLRRWAASGEGGAPLPPAEADDEAAAEADMTAEADSGEASAAANSRLVDAVIADCRRLGLLDDRTFAETKIAAGRRKGHSTRRIGAALAAKGVARDTVAAALAADDTDDLAAALVFARRRRLGPFRTAEAADRAAADRRDLAALCRNGHGFATARRALALDREAAEAILAGEADE